MSRPEHVRCENCCYWLEVAPARFKEEMGCEMPEGYRFGACRRFPSHPVARQEFVHPVSHGGVWCGEFRDSWPGEDRAVHWLRDLPQLDPSECDHRALWIRSKNGLRCGMCGKEVHG